MSNHFTSIPSHNMAWNRIPSEVFDLILEDVDLETIKNVRLVNKVAAQRCLSPRFLSFASHVQTDLTEQSLWKLMARASHPVFSRAVRKLTIVADCYDHRGQNVLFELDNTPPSTWDSLLGYDVWNSREIPRSTYDLEWLRQQQTARDALSDDFIIHIMTSALESFTELQHISLQARVWTSAKERWSPYVIFAPVMVPWATHVCYLTLAAVAKSRSSVPEIDIYGSWEEDSITTDNLCLSSCQFCGVSLVELRRYLAKINEGDGIRLPFETMKLCLSTGIQVKRGSETKWLQMGYLSLFPGLSGAEEKPSHNDQAGVMRLLKATPDLRDLTMNLDGNPDIDDGVHEMFTSVADQISLPQLRKCELNRLPVTSAALLKFLEAHRDLEDLTLRKIAIPADDTFAPVFRFIGAEMLQLSTCTMSEFSYDQESIHLDREAFMRAYCPRRPYLPIEFASGGPPPPDIYIIFVPRAIVKEMEERDQDRNT